MANWKKSQNYKLKKKIENNKKKQVEDIANGKEPREFKMPETRRSTAADALDSYIARRAAREQVYGNTEPIVTGSTRTAGDIMSEAMERMKERRRQNMSESTQAAYNRMDLERALGRAPHSMFSDYMLPLAVQAQNSNKNNPLSSSQPNRPKVQRMVGNVDINDRPIVELGNGQYATTETTFQERWKGDEKNGHYNIGHFATITKDGRKMSDEEMNEYIDKVMSSDDPFETDKKGLNLLYKIDEKLANGEYIRDNNLEQAFQEADAWDVDMHNLQDSMYKDKRPQKVSDKAMESIRNATPQGQLRNLTPEEAVRQRSNGNFSENRLLNAVRRGLDPNNPNSVVTEINNSIVEPSKDPFGEERNQPTKNPGNRIAYSAAARRDPKNPLVRAREEAGRTTGTLPEAIRQYTSMSPMAQQRYHELYGEYGLERAEDFRKSLQNYTNYRIAKENYDETPMLHNPVGRTASQFGHGVNTFTEGMDNSLNYALGMDAKRPQSVSAYQSGITRSRSANKLEEIAQDLARTSGMMAPSALTGQGLQGAGIAAGGKIGSALFSTSIVGNTYQEAINDGYSREQAAAIATYMGADEFITNQIIGGIGGYGGGILGNALKNSRVAQAAAEGIGRAIGEQGAKFAVDLAADAASEGAQEGLQYFTEKIARNLFLKENNEIRLDDPNTWYEAGYEAFLGSLNSVILNSAGAAASSPIESAYNDMVNERRRAEENAYLDLGRETGRLLADDDYRDWQSAAETGTRYYLGQEDNSSMVFEPTVDEEGKLSANIRTNNDLVSNEETNENVVQETTQQQVSDVVNAAVDTLLSERGIENTSESTPDEAKNLTEIAINELNNREMNDYVQKNVHNDVDGREDFIRDFVSENEINSHSLDTGYNNSVSVPRENEQENRLRELASDSINSNNVEKELERRATMRFKDDPDARTIYNAYFEDFADQLKNTDISTRDMVQMYDENMAKAYEAGRNGRAISTLDEDADYRMFDRAFPELTSAIWQMGNNKISSSNRELKNSFRDIYGTQGQSAFDTVVRADANFSDDVDAFNRIYNAGRYGKDIREAGDLSRFGQRRSTEIYESGFKDSADEYDNFSKTVELFKKNPGRAEKGTFINATPRTSKDVRNVMKKFSDSVPFSFVIVDTNDQRSLDSALSQLQKRGLVENQATVESAFKSGSTGAVDTNRAFVVIDINTDNLLNTMGHELTHIAKVYDPEGYRAYSQAVLRKLADTKGYNLEGKIAYMQEQYKAQVGQELSRELAEEEIVAESAAFLNDEDVINELVSKDRTFAEKIRDWLRAVADMIKGLMDNATTRTEAKVLRKDYQAYKNAAELWTKMIDAAADAYAGKAMDEAEMDSAIRNQLDLSEGMGSKVNVPGNPLTAEEIFSLDEEIMAKNDKYNEATRNAWKNIIEADDFVSLGFPHGEYMYYILSPSARKENKWQITHYDKDGPMSDERFKEGDEKRLYDVLESYTPRKGLDVTVVKTSDTIKADDMSVRMQIPVSSEDNTKAEMEDRKTLLAVHNLTEEKLLKTLQLGGIPMPSIAIVKPSDGWDKYGSYSVVFTKDTIAPEVDRRNKVYQADAYTPTVNGIEYDIDSEVYYDVNSKLDKLDMPSYFAEEARRFNNAESGNPTEQGLRGVIDKALDNYGMKAAFLTSKGVEVADTMKEERVPRYSDDNVKIYDSLIAEFGDDLERISEMPIGDQTAEYGERFKKAYLKAFEGGTVKFKLNAANRLVEKILNGTSTRGAEILRHAADYQKNGLQYDVLQTRDTGAINRDLNEKINKAEYEEWLNDLYSGLIKDVGIYNGKERYTYAGDRKSFKQTHYPVTAENIVKVMLGEDSRGATGYQGISSIRAVSMPSFKSVDDIHNSEDRLQKIDEKEINEQLNSLEDRLDNVMKTIAERRKTYFSNIGEAVMDALRNKSYAKAPETAIKNEFSKYNYEATETELKDIVSIIDEANKLPSDMFEAKPERVVGFDEIAYVLAPSTANESTIKTLDDLGIKTVKYDESKENGRTKALQNLNGVRFQISTDTSGRELSSEQSEYFADSKVVDDEGRLMVMYHGTPDGSFNTFRDGINFFTPNKEYATQYEHPSQSSRTAGKAAEAPKTYEVYLNITHPFDIRNAEDRQRFVDDYVKGGWALGIDPYVPYKDTTKTGLPSWEEADNIYEWMDENGLLDEYDGILVDEGGTESGFDRGISYVTFNPNQIKSVDNENPTSTDDIRYQIGIPSEMFYDNNAIIDISQNKGINQEMESQKEIPDSISITEWDDDSFRVSSKKERDFSWAIFNDKGEIVEESKPGAFSPGLSDEEKTAAREKILNIKKAPYENAFIRFGELPKSGKSKNYATNKMENGVSVYDARWDLMKGAYVRTGEALDGAAINYILREAPAYLVTGEVNGKGSDGEPLLKNAKILTKLSYDLDKKGYIPETIRYQRETPTNMYYSNDGDTRSAQANIYLTNMLQASKDLTPSQNDIKKVVKDLTDAYNSNMNKKELTRQISELYTYMRTNEHVDGAQVTDTINAIARQVIREATFVDTRQQELWDNFRKEMKKTDIYVNPEFVRDIDPDGMNALRKRYFGRVNLTSNPAKSGNDGIRTYIQLQQEFPEIFTKHVDDITSDADAINEILYGFEKARPKEMSVFGNASTEEEATADLAQRIMDAYFEVGNESVKTQYQKTYKQLREEMKDDIIREYTDSLRAIEISDSEKLAQLRSAYTAGDISADTFVVSRAALEDYKRQQDQAARDLFRVKRDKYVDRIQRNKYKDDIIKTSKQLAKMIITPTDKQHIPTEMVKPISNVLQYIDFSSNRVNPDGSLPKRTIDSDQFHNSINNILGILNKIDKNNSVYENNGESSYLVIDPDLMQNLRELSDSFAENEELKDNIDNLSTQNLRTVQQTLKALKQMVNNANKFISAGRYESVSEIAQRSISDFDHAITKKGRFRQKVDFARRLPVINMFDDLLTSGMLDAYTFTDALGETGHILYDDVREGLNRKIRNTQTAINYMEDTMERNNVSVKERNQWENDLIEVDLKAVPIGGNTPENMKVKLSAAQIMSLYLLNKRDQARMHLYANETTKNIQNGGFILEPSGRNKLQMDDKHVFKVSEADVDQLVSKLTPQQKAVADDIGRFLTEVTSKWGNEVTQKLYGYNKFEAKNYFPIKVDDSTIATTSSSLENSMFLLKNIGQTKTVQPRAYNPITLQNIFDVYTAQADDMGSYNAFVTSTADLQMWINYKGKEGNVKRSLANAYGQKALQYYMNILKDINMPRENGSKWDKWLGSAVGLQRGGAIWGNLRVAIQQPFAYIRAAATMDPKYLLQGLTLNPAKQAEEWELAKKYAPIAQWKDYGFFDIGVGPSMKRVILGNDTLKDKIADLGMQPASMGDTIAWVRLWYASQAQVKAEHPELEVGSENFYEEAGKVFGHVIDTTQVVDSILHRSEIMKDKSTTVKNATAFLSEPTKTYNMLFRAANDFINAQGPEKRKAAKALANTLVVWIAAQAVNSAVASLISALRMHDKDKDLKEKYIEKVIPDFTDAIQFWNSIPMVKDWLSALTNNEQDDDATYSILSLIPKMIIELKKAAKGESKKGPWGLLYQASQLSTFWGGNNLQNPLRDIDGIIDNLIIGDDMRKYYPYQKAKYNMYATDSKGSYTNLKMFVATAMKAYAKGDKELGDMIVRDLKKKIPEEKVDNIFSGALKEEEGVNTLAKATLEGNQQKADTAKQDLLNKGYSEEMIDKRLNSALKEEVGTTEEIATSFVEKSDGWEKDLETFKQYKRAEGKTDKEIRSSLKSAVTKAYADDYKAADANGKRAIKNKILGLTYDGEKLYSESDFTKKDSTWNKQ